MIGKKRWYILIRHLEKLEEETGETLLKRDRLYQYCPIAIFAPEKDKDGRIFSIASGSGEVFYDSTTYNRPVDTKIYYIYKSSDSIWWYNLEWSTKEKVISKIRTWIRTRKEK